MRLLMAMERTYAWISTFVRMSRTILKKVKECKLSMMGCLPHARILHMRHRIFLTARSTHLVKLMQTDEIEENRSKKYMTFETVDDPNRSDERSSIWPEVFDGPRTMYSRTLWTRN